MSETETDAAVEPAEPAKPLLRVVKGDPTPEELAALIAVVGFWPERIDVPFERTIEQLLAPLEAGTGLPVMYGYKVVEFAANALLFLPLGLIATLALGARRAWWAVAGGFVLSCLVELGQWLLLPDRTPSARDVLANTCGAAVGHPVPQDLCDVLHPHELCRAGEALVSDFVGGRLEREHVETGDIAHVDHGESDTRDRGNLAGQKAADEFDRRG